MLLFHQEMISTPNTLEFKSDFVTTVVNKSNIGFPNLC